jgi:hypothetical protein
VLNLIRSHALLHRATRERDEQGRVVAAVEDYAVVRSLIAELISDGAEATVPHIVRETVDVVERLIEDSGEESVNVRQEGAELDLEYQPAYRRCKMAEEAGFLKNLQDRKGKPARLVIGDAMPEDVEILPRPEALGVFTYLNFSGGVNIPPPPSEIPGDVESESEREEEAL